MKKILVIYYTQTGQIKQITDSITEPFRKDCRLFFEELKPIPSYPFPWNGMPFFQAFPESVQEIPCRLEAFSNDPGEEYDLVIFAYQVWYLSPSIPATSFLKSDTARKLLKGKPVITVLGVRNMWIMAQERVKEMIKEAGGRPVGNIVLSDPAGNLTSVITIVRWMMQGKKEAFRWMGIRFPAAGVPEEVKRGSGVFGKIILKSLNTGNYENLQEALIAAGAVKVDPVLYNIEKRGKMIFRIWSRFVLKKGTYGDPARSGRLNAFKYYLFIVIYLVSPLVAGLFRFYFFLNPSAARRIVERYKEI